MKKVYFFFALVAASTLFFSYAPPSQNGKTGSNSAPGESSCASCHGGAGNGSTNLTSDIPASGFVPGTTYNMVLTVTQAGQPLFGLGVESLSTANAQAGSFTAGTGTQVQTKTARQNLIHVANGGVGNGSKAFAFKWTAPTVAAGNVTFYFAGLAANGDGTENAQDNTYTGSSVFAPQTTVTPTTLTLNCPTNVLVQAVVGSTTAIAPYTAPTATSTCTTGSVTTTKTSGLVSGAAFPIGVNNVCYSATDGCGNTKSCCFTVTVMAPAATSTLTLNCPTDITQAVASGATTAVVNYTAPTATSTCTTGAVTTTKASGLASGAAFPIGTNAVCYTATDGCGNTKNCCFNVIVTSNVAPTSVLTLNCPTDITQTVASGATTEVVNYTAPTATSTCTTGAVTTTKASGLASGAAFPIGTNAVCYTATDGCGNTKNCCFNVIVKSTIVTPTSVLTLNCPADITVIAPTGSTSAVVTYIDPVATSTCATGTVTTTKISGLASGTAFPIGTNMVCYTAKDGCGNIKNCCVSITVNAAGTNTICNQVQVQADENSIKIFKLPKTKKSLTSITTSIIIRNTTTNAIVYQCSNCGKNSSLSVKNLPRGTYSVQIDLKQYGLALCQKTVTVIISEGDDDDEDDDDKKSDKDKVKEKGKSDLRINTNNNSNQTQQSNVNRERLTDDLALEEETIVDAKVWQSDQKIKSFTLFPNPAQDLINVDVTDFVGQKVNILVFNQLGMVVKTQTIQEASGIAFAIDLEGFANGFYTISLISNGNRKTNKFVVHKK
jgi:HYR domain/Secretion system C-terminal sorting domain